MDAYALSLIRSEPLRRPILREIIASLHLPEGSHGLDVGCGIGLQTLLLAQAVGKNGHVTGMDALTSFLEIAKEHSHQARLSDRVSYHPGSWERIPFEEGVFDWVWSADAAGYAAQNPLGVVAELARVVKPGGRVILLYWSAQTLLPGYPALEARLNASPAGIAPFRVDAQPETHYLRAMGWMNELGLIDPSAGTFARTITAPLDSDLRDALTALFEMRWGAAEADVSADDWLAYQRLCQPTSPEFILNCPGYYAFFTYTVFSGTVPVKGSKIK